MFQQLIQEVVKMIQRSAGVRSPGEVMGEFLDERRSHAQFPLFLRRDDFSATSVSDKESVMNPCAGFL